MATIAGRTGEWEIVIGMEVHAQVISNAKLFSGAATAFGAGFFVAGTSAAPHITSALNNLGTWLSHL